MKTDFFITEKDSRTRIAMDEKQKDLYLKAVFDRFGSKVKADPDCDITALFEESVGALQKQLKSGTIQPSKLGPHERQDSHIDIAHIVERGKAEIAHARRQLREGRTNDWVIKECLPKTKVMSRVIGHYVDRDEKESLKSMIEEILTPTTNKQGDERGRPKTAIYMREYLASEYGVDPDTIRVWEWQGRRAAKAYAKDPEKIASVFGEDLADLQRMSEHSREQLLLGKSVNLAGGKTIALTTWGAIGVSILSD